MHHRKSGDDMNWERLAAYFADECSASETAELDRWIDAEPGRRTLVDGAREVWERAGKPADVREAVDLDMAWSRMAARVRAHAGRESPQRVTSFRSGAKGTGYRYMSLALRAAVAIIIVAVAGVLWRTQAKRGGDVAPATAELRPMREYATVPGQRAVLQLTDGTRIDLSVDSRLRVPADFGAAAREIYLEGEAYFAVAHNDRKPFVVHTARGTARDIGTRFNLRAYADDASLAVVVAEGAVVLKAASVPDTARFPRLAAAPTPSHPPAPDSVILTEADLGRLDAEGRLSVERDVDVGAHIAWTEGRLLFVNTPLREVIPQLNRWYDIDVRLGDSSLGDYTYTVALKDEPLSHVLELLSGALDVRIEQRGKTITLHRRHA